MRIFSLIFNCIIFLGLTYACFGNDSNFCNQTYTQNSRPWLSKIFAEAKEHFSIHTNATEECKTNFALFNLHLRNNSIWAVRMSESSEWPTVGLFMGMGPYFGHFDECLAVDAHNVKGQYCLVDSTVNFKEFADMRPRYAFDTLKEDSSAYAALQMYKHDKLRKIRDKFFWSICVPESCTDVDLKKSLDHSLNDVFSKYSINITTNVLKSRCHTNRVELTSRYHLTKYFFIFSVLIVIFSSIIHQIKEGDVTEEKPGLRSEIINCFSIQKNCNTLTNVIPEREYMLLHLFKMFTIASTIILHRVMYSFYHVHHDANTVEQFYHRANKLIFWAPELVDVAFSISAILTYFDFTRSNEKETVVDIVKKIAKRWLRLFSVYLVIRLFYAHILPVMKDGPLWHEVQKEADVCQIQFLEALLTLPSARNHELCISSSWSLAVDFQAFIIVYICLHLSKFYRIKTIWTLLFLLVSSCIVTFFLNFFKYSTLIILYVRVFLASREDTGAPGWSSTYASIFARLGSYVVGILVAMIAYQYKKQRYRFSKIQQICGMTIAIFLKFPTALLSVGLYELFQKNQQNPLWFSIHGATYHILSNAPIIFFILVYLVNGFERLEKRVPRIVVPISRLSNTVSLCNFPVILSHIFSRRSISIYPDTFSLVHTLTADLVISYIVGFLLYLLIEGPVQGLVNLKSSGTRKVGSQKEKDQTEVGKKYE